MAIFFFGNNLEIGYCGVQYRVPVDQALTTVNQIFIVELNKYFLKKKMAISGTYTTRLLAKILF